MDAVDVERAHARARRLHRFGGAALAQARRDAAWIETSTSNRQKLILATVIET
ncbi:hypothetical protein [Undibacterium luofuense]|uniref:hypothetical protein n=1 Tax=Undibacterium luofuense TaxID=2828733 RepID=UPI0030ECEE68